MRRMEVGEIKRIGRCIVLAALLGLSGVQAAEKLLRPNILFILVDDQRNDSLGCAGHPFIQTPNIDRLAGQGVRFGNMFVTTSICMASRATIFAGLTQRSHGYRPGDPQGSADMIEEDFENCFPMLLRQAGYRTGFFGKNHVRFERGTTPAFDAMFDQWGHIHRNPYFKKMPDGSTRHCAELIGDRSVAFLEAQPADKPFCLYMSFNISHAEDKDHRPGIGHFPWPKAVDGMYEDIMPPRPRLDAPKYFEALPDFLKNSLNRTRWYWRWDTPDKYTLNMRALYRMISGMDRVLGRVLETLEKQGVAENTVIIYTADNGYYMGDRGLAGKWSHFEQSLRVPLIIYDPRLPKGKRGRVVSPMALNLDLPSTMLNLAGIPIPKTYQGRSLVPIVEDQMPGDWRTGFFCEHHQLGGKIPAWAGIRGERYVYARYDRQDPPYEFLHDLQRDPDQLGNFADDPEYKAILKEFRTQTDDCIRKYTRPEIEARRKTRSPGKARSSAKSASHGRVVDRGRYEGGIARFGGKSFLRLDRTPALEVGDSYTWALRVKVLLGNPPGAVLLGNRNGRTDLNFMKFTARRGVQLFAGNKRVFKMAPRISEGVWTEVVLVKDGGRAALYLDGKKVAEEKVGVSLPAMPCYLGGDPGVRNEMARCEISHAAVFRRAIPENQLQMLFKRE